MATKKPLVVNGGGLQEIAAADTIEPANLATGTRDGTKFLRDDGQWAAGGGASTLAGLSDVAISTPVDGDRLQYEAATSKWKNLPGLQEITKDPTGFGIPENVTMDYNAGTKTITLGGSSWNAWYKGKLVAAIVSGTTITHALTPTTPIFLYWNGAAFIFSTTEWTFDVLMIAQLAYDSSGNFLFALRECHGLMPWQVHRELHAQIGTYKTAGGIDTASYTLASTTAANRRPNCAATTIWDEDVQTILAAKTDKANYCQMVLAGAGAVAGFTPAGADIVPLSTNQPFYNQFTGGAWQQTLMPNNAYMPIWLVAIPATNDATSQGKRYIWVQGQTQSTTLATIQALSPSDVTLGTFASNATEWVFLARIIIRYTSANWVLTQVDVISIAKNTSSTAIAGLSAVSTTAALSGNGTAAAPLDLTIASYSQLGGVKIGSGVAIAGDGTISTSGTPWSGTTTERTMQAAISQIGKGNFNNSSGCWHASVLLAENSFKPNRVRCRISQNFSGSQLRIGIYTSAGVKLCESVDISTSAGMINAVLDEPADNLVPGTMYYAVIGGRVNGGSLCGRSDGAVNSPPYWGAYGQGPWTSDGTMLTPLNMAGGESSDRLWIEFYRV